MFCPKCESEYREGITTCATCQVPLVDTPDGSAGGGQASHSATPGDHEFVHYCGFLDLDGALDARERLRQQRVLAHVLIRESPSGSTSEDRDDEFWLLVPRAAYAEVREILGEDLAAQDADGFACSACGAHVPEEAARCPSCGAKFEDGP